MQAICKLTPTILFATLWYMSNHHAHILHLHAVARFQLALASECILKSQVTNHLIYRHNSGGSRVCVSGASVSYLAGIFAFGG